MKKTLIVTMTDGKTVERDLTAARDLNNRIIPLGTPANDPAYLDQCALLAVSGIVVEANKEYAKYAGPGMIKHIEIVFENQLVKS